MQRPSNYDVLVTITLRAWNGEDMEPMAEGFHTIERFDDLVGIDHSAEDALRIARRWTEAQAARMISTLAQHVLQLRWEQQVLPFA